MSMRSLKGIIVAKIAGSASKRQPLNTFFFYYVMQQSVYSPIFQNPCLYFKCPEIVCLVSYILQYLSLFQLSCNSLFIVLSFTVPVFALDAPQLSISPSFFQNLCLSFSFFCNFLSSSSSLCPFVVAQNPPIFVSRERNGVKMD